ncbi:hypothetical protein K1T71_004786 [Dendrolimus kikuchii]|uniref:Uncharacterized protein n=1 Tax=Dendrolimus kikuchii TaxID=765133 RepID=A0ACC1D8L1_9NEOP|nr:hypothetical protein K1T71_004786 [Dendrolimus kikuchii]
MFCCLSRLGCRHVERQMAIERCAAAAAAAAAGGQADGAPATPGGASPSARPSSPCGAPGAPPPPTRIITLEHGEHLDSTLYRFEKGYQLVFRPGPSLLGRKVFLYTNYVLSDNRELASPSHAFHIIWPFIYFLLHGPLIGLKNELVVDEEKGSDQAEFIRNQYYALEWARDAPAEGDDGGEGADAGPLLVHTDVHCALRLARAGSFHYYFVYDTAESPIGPQGSGWFQVSPTLRVGAGDETIPLDALMCQTVLAKCLGPLPRWEAALRVARETGYNMVHFTPIQVRPRPAPASPPPPPPPPPDANRGLVAGAGRLQLELQHREPAAAEPAVLSICDVVLNHTANETPWLATHPEATYNCGNCPHLRPAALLDALLARLSVEVARGEHEPRGVPRAVTRHEHVEAVRHLLASQLLPDARLHEMYTCNVAELVQEFYFMARNKVPSAKAGGGGGGGGGGDEEPGELKLVPDPQLRRLRATVDMELALRLYNVYRGDCYEEETRLRRCCDELRRHLEQLNEAAAEAVREHLRAAVDNVVAGMRYFRLSSEGPRVEEVSAKHPLAPRYFTWACAVESASPAEVEAALYGDAGHQCMAHNGWVMDADPLADFAARDAAGRVYLRRELIAWGDSVKLRYGARPDDSPFLWRHMRDYVELTAEVFDGLRLDNCHSTPLHVAEYMLDCARNVKPDLYVVAELFTNSDHVDNIFVNRLGITSLIREAQSAWDSHEQGRLVHRFGGRAVGAFLREPRRAAAPRVAHAMLLDLTHDNPSPVEKRCVFDVLPSAALVAMACCATGSTRGYDELVPHHIHVVDETRLYPAWGEGGDSAPDEPRVGLDTGIVAAKRALNELHRELALGGYSEVYVDQMDGDVVAVTRHEPRSRRSVVLVAFTAFTAPEPDAAAAAAGRRVRPLRFEGQLDEISAFARHPRLVNGLAEYACEVRRGVPLARSAVFAGARVEGAHTVLEFRPLAPGVVVAVREARAHILGYAACLRHGLIPNLLDGGRNARYNCRDAVWWWLHSIRHYCAEAPQGHAILAEPVSRLFPTDEAEAAPPGAHDQPLHDVGLVFRERNAGRAIDAHMADKGFNVQIGVDPDTGFVFGGNDANCGTWMDKMGSSEAAGTRGTPATPRDGSAVELVALAYAAAAWLAAQHRAGRYPYPGVVRRHRDGSLTSWSYAQWAERIRRHFERHFWVPPAPSALDARPDLVHRRAIYKDSHGATRPWADYQLRCNFPIAMAVAPDLFEPKHAWLALDQLERLLLGPLGVKTLDPADWAYRPDYDNGNDGDDPAVAHGHNYHQGPEWLWPLGFYVRARLAFAHQCGRHARTVAHAYATLAPLLAEVRTSPWRGLPELTNAQGAYCADSCRTQAWSSALALEALHELRAARRATPLAAD